MILCALDLVLVHLALGQMGVTCANADNMLYVAWATNLYLVFQAGPYSLVDHQHNSLLPIQCANQLPRVLCRQISA
jgi:hypothetical protein